MTELRDTVASLDGRLDDVRREHAWRAVARKLDAASNAPPPRWPWLFVPTAAALATAVLLLVVRPPGPMAHREEPARRDIVAVTPQPRATEPAPVDADGVVRSAVAGGALLARIVVGAGERVEQLVVHETLSVHRRPGAAALYAQAEAALARHDASRACALLERVVKEYPGSALVDPARYDLALLAHSAGDDAKAVALVEEVLATGTNANVRAAAERLRERLAR